MKENPTIYQQLKTITTKTKWPEIFLTDLTTHDRKSLQQTEEGDCLIWTLRQDGTSLSRCPKTLIRQGLQRNESYNEIERSVKSSADMIKCNYDEYIFHRKEPAAKFYRIEVGHNQRGIVKEITPDQALFVTRFDGNDFRDLYCQLTEQQTEVFA